MPWLFSNASCVSVLLVACFLLGGCTGNKDATAIWDNYDSHLSHV